MIITALLIGLLWGITSYVVISAYLDYTKVVSSTKIEQKKLESV